MRERRRNLWAEIGLPEPSGSEQHGPPATMNSASALLDSLRVAQLKARNRRWERSHPSHTYRSVTVELQAALKEIAAHLEVNLDEVARAFLEFSLQCYLFDEIRLQPHPKGPRMTLFPKSGCAQPAWVQKFSGPEPVVRPATGKKSKGIPAPSWKARVSYRLPAALHAGIRQAADKHYLPVGEVVSVFLVHALEAYQAGRLVLNPQSKT